jgi:hypothetical protein
LPRIKDPTENESFGRNISTRKNIIIAKIIEQQKYFFLVNNNKIRSIKGK